MELLGVSVFLPFIQVLMEPERVQSEVSLRHVYEMFHFQSSDCSWRDDLYRIYLEEFIPYHNAECYAEVFLYNKNAAGNEAVIDLYGRALYISSES